jgi:hypothetical protein
MTYRYPSQAPSMVGGNACVGTLIKNRDQNLTGCYCIFGGIFGRKETEELFNISPRE